MFRSYFFRLFMELAGLIKLILQQLILGQLVLSFEFGDVLLFESEPFLS
jgi:hypothetical protein